MQYKVEREFRKNFFLEPEVARLYIESAFVNSSNNQKLKCSIDSTKHKSTKCGKIVLSLRAPKSWHHFVSKAKLEEHVKIQQHHFESLSFSILMFCLVELELTADLISSQVRLILLTFFLNSSS